MGGKNKAFVQIRGESIIERTVRIFNDLFDETILVTNAPLEYLEYDVTIVTDIIKNKAALGGIFTGLFHASSDLCFVAACDMPFLDKGFIEYMIHSVAGYDIIVPHPADGFQPLHAIYSRKCISFMRKLIDRDELRIRALYRKFKTLYIPAAAITPFDPEGRMFLNINSKKDLEKIKAFQ